MRSTFDNALSYINQGRRGSNKGIPFRFPKLNELVNINKRVYTLLGGASGTGKSAMVDLLYVLGPYSWYLLNKDETDTKVKIIVRSMERSKERRILKWIAIRLFVRNDIVVDVPFLAGWGSKKAYVSDELYAKIVECRKYFDLMEDVVEVIDGQDSPTGIYKHLRRIAHQDGTLYKYVKNGDGNYAKAKSNPSGGYTWLREDEGPQIDPYEPLYVPKDDKLITLFIIDYIKKLKTEGRFNEKQNLDKMTEYCTELRDLYGMSPVVVSQFNRNITDTSRRSNMTLLPEDSDFAGTSDMYNDCDLALALFNPYKYSIDECVGYPVGKFVNNAGYNRFRSLSILKNSYGIDNVVLGYNFIGENGLFRELPKADEIPVNQYDRFANPNAEYYTQ